MSDTVSKQITKECSKIFPLENVLIKKVKVLKKPKFDVVKLMEMHGDDASEDTGAAIDRPAEDTLVETVAGEGGRL